MILRGQRKGARLGGEATVKACILLFLVLFSWPFLGVPLFLAGVFLFWAVLVYALFAASRRAGK